MSEDRPSPWSRPDPASQQPGWESAGSSTAPLPASLYAAAPPSVPPQSGHGVPPVHVHLNPPAAPGRGLGVAGVVLAGLALVVALLALAVGGFSVFGAAGDSGGGYGIRGILAPAKGGTVTGPVLADEVATKITEDGGDPEGITCPDTQTVARDVTTVCHGLDLGSTSTFLVFFEDERGTFTLLEI